VNQLIIHGHAVKTLESKETKAQRNETVTHNSVFAAHRLQCRMTIARSTSGILLSSTADCADARDLERTRPACSFQGPAESIPFWPATKVPPEINWTPHCAFGKIEHSMQQD
jgi:hypothetical protein